MVLLALLNQNHLKLFLRWVMWSMSFLLSKNHQHICFFYYPFEIVMIICEQQCVSPLLFLSFIPGVTTQSPEPPPSPADVQQSADPLSRGRIRRPVL